MWCSHCQQDTPPVAAISDESAVCCAGCGQPFESAGADQASADDHSPHAAATLLFDTSILDLHDWRLDDDLADAERLIRSIRGAAPQSAGDGVELRVAPAGAIEFASPPSRAAGAAKRSAAAPRIAACCSWAALSLGVMTFAAGGVLLAWSFFTGRSELWSFGLPMTLAGQAGLLIGLILQLEGLWQSNRSTAQSLDALDERLSDLRQAASLLSTSHGTHSQSFYAHMADGASPNILLADLKGQLDLLAVRLAKERAA